MHFMNVSLVVGLLGRHPEECQVPVGGPEDKVDFTAVCVSTKNVLLKISSQLSIVDARALSCPDDKYL